MASRIEWLRSGFSFASHARLERLGFPFSFAYRHHGSAEDDLCRSRYNFLAVKRRPRSLERLSEDKKRREFMTGNRLQNGQFAANLPAQYCLKRMKGIWALAVILIDGRTVYSPLFSGVFRDAQDAVLEDVDRIEAISEAGATLWGVNAANGVINVIARAAEGAQGRLQARDDPELSVAAQRLRDSSHGEFGAAPARSEFDRGVFLKLAWQP